jgi:hypothetical protein
LTGLSTNGPASADEVRRWVLERLLAREDPRAHRGRARYIANEEWAATLGGLEAEGLITMPVDRPRLTRAGRDHIQRARYLDVSPPRTLPYCVKAGPMASGDIVVKDGLTWDQLRAHGAETVAGLEMEAATVARTASGRDDLPWVVVKGVMDYADPRKDDRLKPFAARASAEVMFRLLTSQLAPRAQVRLRTNTPTTIPTASAALQRTEPTRQRSRFFWLGVSVSVIAAALLAAAGYALSQSPGGRSSVMLNGSVVCDSGRPVVGVWIAASTGQEDSGLAHLGPPDPTGTSYPTGSSGTYSYRLPHGGSYAIHVGCGGTAQNWASSNYSPLLSSPTVHLSCHDPSASARHTNPTGPCRVTPAG